VPGARWRYSHTYMIDLTRSVEELWSRLSHETAYKIRRARDRDQVTCEVLDPNDPVVIDRFERAYNEFAVTKALPSLDRRRLEGMARAGALDLTRIKDGQGNSIALHANYRNQYRASGVYLPAVYRKCSDSSVRNAMGRANRYATWRDILHYKEQGLQVFDFGGWYMGTNSEMLKINEFKRGFGGEVVREYKCEQVLTQKGRIVLAFANLLNRARAFANGQNKNIEKPVYARAQDCEVSATV